MAILVGMKDICKYVRKSEATVLDMIRMQGMPAKKITGWIWESDTELIDSWRRSMIQAGEEDPSPPPPKKKPKRNLDRHRRK